MASTLLQIDRQPEELDLWNFELICASLKEESVNKAHFTQLLYNWMNQYIDNAVGGDRDDILDKARDEAYEEVRDDICDEVYEELHELLTPIVEAQLKEELLKK